MRDTKPDVEIVHGTWWWPDAPHQRFPGTLEITHSGDSFLTVYITSTPPAYFSPLLCGRAVGGPSFTLLNCYQQSSTVGLLADPDAGFGVARYYVQTILRNARYEDPESVRFREIVVSFDGVREWFAPPALRTFGAQAAEHSPPAPVEAQVDGAQITIETGLSKSLRQHEVVLRDEAIVRIATEQELSLDEWHRLYVRPLENLMTLFIGRPALASEIRFLGDRESNPDLIELVSPHEPNPAAKASRYDMRVTFQDIKDEWSSALARWLRLSQNDNGMLNVFFSTRYKSDMFIEQIFLSVVQALEAFHRINNESSVASEEEHLRRVQKIREAVPERDREWLERLMKFGNGPSLRERLVDLINATEDLLEPFVRSSNGVAIRVAATRNFLVHRFTPKDEKELIGPEDMWEWCCVISLVMSGTLFRHLFPNRPTASLYAGASQEYAFQKSRISLP